MTVSSREAAPGRGGSSRATGISPSCPAAAVGAPGSRCLHARGHDTRVGTHRRPPGSRGDGRDPRGRGWRRVALGQRPPLPAPPGSSGPDSTSPARLIIPNPHPGRRINKACLLLPRRSGPSAGPLPYSSSFHTATIPSLEGHLQELSRVGRGRGADPRQEAKQEPARLCSG